jgi:hypothetical protein
MTFSNSSLASQTNTSKISSKPVLIERSTKNSLGTDIKLVEVKKINQTSVKSFSPRLINYVEPYEKLSTGTYTTFYTEVNSGLNVGDRVFIVNGNYDSDILIKKDKYRKGRDGFKVLEIENCKITLDIEYTGQLPWNDEKIDNFIGLYYVQNYQDFIHANRQITTRNATQSVIITQSNGDIFVEGSLIDYKFNYYQNNIIFVDGNFPAVLGWGKNGGLSGGRGFYVRNGTTNWTNISSSFGVGSYSFAHSPVYQNNNRVKVYNGSFTASIGTEVVEFKEGFVYKWDMKPEPDAISGTKSIWLPDVTYSRPIITKGNFRDGNFGGVWNTGLFGRQDKKIKWEGNTSIWNGGSLLNTEWNQGEFKAIHTQNESWFAELNYENLPYQKQNRSNNNSKSFNYVIDSEIKKTSAIRNGTFITSKIGVSSTYSVVESHLLQQINNNDVNVFKAIFENCTFVNGTIENSEIIGSRAVNTLFNKVKSINSDYKLSVIKNSTYISDEIIKIIGYDEFTMSEIETIANASHKVFKFYINEKDFYRLKLRDRFYIKGLKFPNAKKYPFNLFDRRFRVGTWTEYTDFYSGDLEQLQPNMLSETFYKRGIQVGVFLSTPEENSWSFYSTIEGTRMLATQSEKRFSIDIAITTIDKDSIEVKYTGEQTTYDIPVTGLNINYNTTELGKIVGRGRGTNILNLRPIFIGNNIDISTAYIIESDFESGIIETTNWNSGNHINYNNDVNITQYTNQAGFYDLTVQTSSSTLIVNTGYNSLYYEAGENCLSTGNVVFLHSVDYDTIGKVSEIQIIASGSNYLSTNDILITGPSSSGVNLTIDITADTIGEVLSITYSTPPLGGGYSVSDGTYQTSINGIQGSGLLVEYVILSGQVMSIELISGGVDYTENEIIYINAGTPISAAAFSIRNVTFGGVLSATISTSGIKYKAGQTFSINSPTNGDDNAVIEIISTTGSLTRLPESYKILSNINGQLELQEVTATTSVISRLLDGGLSYTRDAQNRYSYIYKALINKSKIRSGIFRRAFIKNSLIEDVNYDLTDKDFNNMLRIKNLMLSDMLFNDTGNILSNATYINSNFMRGSDVFRNGIVNNSLWIGTTFSNGTFEYSTWFDGTFNSGLFYENRSFNANPGSYSEYYDKNNTWMYIRDGQTTATISNSRYSWMNGTFSSGEFFKSDWESGNFRDGKFYYSKWYNGNAWGGFFGDDSVETSDTHFYNGRVYFTNVENAKFFSIDTSLYGLSNSTINWYNGIFNSGLFGSDIIQKTASHNSVWWNGDFNGGEFVTNAKWKNGTFNGGKFKTKYGWTMSDSSVANEYAWENGVFNGGEFGVGDLYFSKYNEFYDNGNPSWFTGDFNGGVFKGRVWNNGIFSGGDFEGSATISVVAAIGTTSSSADEVNWTFREWGDQLPEYPVADGITSITYTLGSRVWYNGILYSCIVSSVTTAIPSTTQFSIVSLDNFISKFYGLWRNGIFTNIKDKFITDKKLYTQATRNSSTEAKPNIARISNTVWKSGTFNHSNGFMKNSVWLDGIFESGQFNESSFNPYVRRQNSTTKTFNINDLTCYWNNGFLVNSDFYISNWNNGVFISGTGYGMIFKGGVSNYMNAYNVFWENGTWRNGNWNGSFFDLSGSGIVTDDFVRQILFRGMSWSGTSSTHTWNIFIERIVSDNIRVASEMPNSLITPGPLSGNSSNSSLNSTNTGGGN